tara:strand:+ start:967 stop:1113 length:147 start_codon:yes stop_codon:yes gene_type:complete
MIREIIFHEDIVKEYLDERSKLNTKEEKQALAEEYSIRSIKEYKDVSD